MLSSLRRTALRVTLRAQMRQGNKSGPLSGPAQLLSSLPPSLLVALERDGPDPVLRATDGRVRRVALPMGLRAWLVTGYEEVRSVLADHETFSTDFANLVGKAGVAGGLDPGGLGFADPPRHTRMRHMLTPHFTRERLKALTPRISAIIDAALDNLQREVNAYGQADLVEQFSLPVPTLTICELLGVPYDEREQFQRLSAARFDIGQGAGRSLGAVSESLDYLEALVGRRRREPDSGLLGGIVAAHGSEFTDRELAGVADGLLTGGIETTASMLTLGTWHLLEDRDTFARLTIDQPAVAPYVEEALRKMTVVQVAFPRFARHDLDVAGCLVRRDDIVICVLSAADRDPHIGDSPDLIDTAAPRRPHLAFGHGIHRCMGAELARLELRLAFPALARRLPDLRLAVDAAKVEFRGPSLVFGAAALPVTNTSVE